MVTMISRRQRQLAAACAISLATTWGFAQQDSGPATPATDLEAARAAVADLASESWLDRKAASDVLEQLARALRPETALHTLETALAEWLADRGASAEGEGDRAEVLARFELEAKQAFFNAPRAGLGITYDRTPADRGVRLGDTVANFDAHGKLRAGDIVLALSGAPIKSGSMDLPVSIASHLPGEETVISLLRNGEPMEVTVTLGRRKDLRSVAALDERVLRRAWALRMDRLRGQKSFGRLDTDLARSVVTAPPSASTARLRAAEADVALGGQPGQYAARRAGVVAQTIPGNDPLAGIRAELSRLNGDLAGVVRRAIEIEQSVRKLELEVHATADTADGRATAERLRGRITELRNELGPLQREQTRLMQERVRLIEALSQ